MQSRVFGNCTPTFGAWGFLALYLTLRTGVRLAYVSYVYEILYLLTISPPTPTSSSYSLSLSISIYPSLSCSPFYLFLLPTRLFLTSVIFIFSLSRPQNILPTLALSYTVSLCAKMKCTEKAGGGEWSRPATLPFSFPSLLAVLNSKEKGRKGEGFPLLASLPISPLLPSPNFLTC